VLARMLRPRRLLAAVCGTVAVLLVGGPLLPMPPGLELAREHGSSRPTQTEILTLEAARSARQRATARRSAAASSIRALRAARRWARHRTGRVAFAFVDRGGRLRGQRAGAEFLSASLVKAMLLVADLRRLDASGHALRAPTKAALSRMIRRSDNAAADAIYARVGDRGLDRLARAVGMRRFRSAGHWASAVVTAADQVRFFARFDRLTPASHRRLARRLLSTVVPDQRWGIPRAVPAGGHVFFKGGWRPTTTGNLVHQAGLVERQRGRTALAVLTDGNPSHAYGVSSVRGIARRILAPR